MVRLRDYSMPRMSLSSLRNSALGLRQKRHIQSRTRTTSVSPSSGLNEPGDPRAW